MAALLHCCRPAGDAVTHTMILLNNGNVALRGLNIGGVNLSSTAVNCSFGDPTTTLTPVANPVPNLPVNAYLTCTSTYTFIQEVIELGDAHHKTLASSVNIVPSSSAAFTKSISLASVTVPNNPSLQAYVHTDDSYCDDHTLRPNIAREYDLEPPPLVCARLHVQISDMQFAGKQPLSCIVVLDEHLPAHCGTFRQALMLSCCSTCSREPCVHQWSRGDEHWQCQAVKRHHQGCHQLQHGCRATSQPRQQLQLHGKS
jgi:hypothetical protein